ncbi:hypothetical protein ABE82_26735 (plasmid) [Paenibacillus peoriae]|uniref:hypothetical protein n=1 Tax=Paenibacillus peoriae TaxID=59893 RepID=UPI00071FCC84|nr:hypothetical protein [Paenibacillus peoriae]ALS10009.1 hypothetical protein ABE82_26735 [Paenibacillus peoriae]
MSWIMRTKDTKEVMTEVNNEDIMKSLVKAGYEAITWDQYLNDLKDEFKEIAKDNSFTWWGIVVDDGKKVKNFRSDLMNLRQAKRNATTLASKDAIKLAIKNRGFTIALRERRKTGEWKPWKNMF